MYRRSPATLALHVAGALIAWFAPEDALTRWPALKAAVTIVGNIFPLLPNAVASSRFPDVTALYFALMLVATPLRLWGSVRFFYGERSRAPASYSSLPWGEKLIALTALPFLACAGVFFMVNGYYYELNIFSISGSRLWLGLVGPLFAGGDQIACIAMGVVWFLLFLRYIFTPKGA
jgi:hypothetical protein